MANARWHYGMIVTGLNIAPLAEEVEPAKIAHPPERMKDVEPISHSFARIGSTLLLTIMVRYHRAMPTDGR